jgi:cysteine-rich repeat protein
MGFGGVNGNLRQRRATDLQSRLVGLTFVGIALLACDSIPLSTASAGAAGMAGMGGSSGMAGAGGASAGNAGVGGLSSLTVSRTNLFRTSLASGGTGASGGSGGTGASGAAGGGVLGLCIPNAPSGSPPSSPVCGDGFRAPSEDCDDHNSSDTDSCSPSCKVTPELVDPRAPASGPLPPPSRSLGASRHPLAAACNLVGVSFVDQTSEPPALKLSTYSSSGVPGTTLQYGVSSVDFPDPAVAALPGDGFAIAWTDLGADGDELGIQLRRVLPSATEQPPPLVANEATEFSQSAPDLVFDGKELVVAWMDSANPATAPDLRYRLFAPDLTPLGGDLTLASTSAVEGDVALAAFNGAWAAAWRSDAAGLETIEVQSGATHWSVGPFLPGLAGDRPDLTFLDATHLAVAFTMGTDPNSTGVANVSRLHGAILDAAAPGHTASFAIPPAQDPYSSSPSIDQSEPALAIFPDHLLVSWRSGAAPGDAKNSELWSRRMPFTIAPDHSLTVDPSHVEQPLVRTDAQRAGDQSVFRLLSTNLWPSGGLVAAWNDHGRSFHNLAGVPDVAVQFLPDLSEPAPPVTPYPVSADGKYYYVNLLRRNYAPPTASATFANDAAQYFTYVPEGVFDGGEYGFAWSTPSPSDPDATATLTVDMRQYSSIGAVRTLYYRNGAVTAGSHRIRLATIPGNWTTVLPMTATTSIDTTYSFDGVNARYLELTMVGSPASARVQVAELFAYPSAPAATPPTSASGYDLGYLATSSSVNNNFFPPGQFPMSWPAGDFWAKTLAQGATGDAIGTVDLGAQYSVARVALCFTGGAPWANGGRVEVGAIPDTYGTIFDSGPGKLFGLTSTTCQDYRFPAQPVRYIRATDYFISGIGPSAGILWSLQAFTNPAPQVTYYPLSADGKYFNVNLLRRPADVAQPTASVVYANGALPYSPNVQAQNPANAIDGDDDGFAWSTSVANPDATATLTIDLGLTETLGAIFAGFGGLPVAYSLRAAQTPGVWTQVIPDRPIGTNTIASFDPVTARYLELTMRGTTGARIVNLNELVAYPSSTTDPAPSSTSRLNLMTGIGMSVSANANMNGAGSAAASVQQLYFSGKSVAQGATGDGTITYDLGQQYQVSQIGLPFYIGRNWPGGGKIDVDDGSGTWVTVFDSGRGTPLGLATGTQTITFPTHTARYIRFTDYFIPGVGTSPGGFFMNFELF